MAYINPDILQNDWDDITGWTSQDDQGGVSSISPAGQLYQDCRAGVGLPVRAGQTKDFGTIGNGDYYLEFKFAGDVWDGGSNPNLGLFYIISAGLKDLFVRVGNGFTAGDGILIFDGSGYVRVLANTFSNSASFHTLVLKVHTSQTLCDGWLDKAPTEAADFTNAGCDFDAGNNDGVVLSSAYGSILGNGEYHQDYMYIGSGLATVAHTFSGNDTARFTDTVSALRGLKMSFTSTLIFSDTLSALKGLKLNLSSTISLSDTIKYAQSILKQTIITLSEARNLSLNITQQSIMTLSDTMSNVKGFFATITSTLSLTDTISALRGLKTAIVSTITLTDTKNLGFGIFKQSVITLSETLSQRVVWVINVITTITLTDIFRTRNIWNSVTKHISSWSHPSKNTSTWVFPDKHIDS